MCLIPVSFFTLLSEYLEKLPTDEISCWHVAVRLNGLVQARSPQDALPQILIDAECVWREKETHMHAQYFRFVFCFFNTNSCSQTQQSFLQSTLLFIIPASLSTIPDSTSPE